MKDYKLSELKEICLAHCIHGMYECESVTCPIRNECVTIGAEYFADMEIEGDNYEGKSNN